VEYREVETEGPVAGAAGAPPPLEHDPVAVELALASTGVGVYEFDVATGRQRLSSRAKALWGLPPDEDPTPAQVLALVHPDDRPLLHVARDSLRPDGPGEFTVEYRIVRPDGATRWLEVRGRTLFAVSGAERSAVRSLGVILDVTDRREGERRLAGTLRALADSEQRLRTVFEQAHDFIFTADLEQRITSCNPAVAAAIGLRPEDLIGRSIGDFIDPAQFARTRAMLDKKLAEGGTTRYEVEVVARDGTPMTWEVGSTLTFGPDGRPTGLHAIARDVTDKRRAEERIRGSEARFRNFANSIPALAWAADAAGGVTFFNRPWYEYTGQTPAEAMPYGWRAALHPDDRTRVSAAIAHAVQAGEAFTIEYRVVRHDGVYRWFLAHLVPDSDSGATPAGWFGTAVDVDDAKITEQILREQERALRESDARLRIALESARAGVFDWNVDADRVEWTEGYYALLGLEPGSVPASQALWRRHVHPEDLARVESELRAAIAQGGRFASDYRILGADGIERWVQGRALVLYGPGEPTRVIGALVDITERKRTNDRLREADRRKDEFLATLAHELRNPLAPIRTAAHVLASPKLSAEQLTSTRRVIQRQVAHMAYLLDDLLDVARITRGKLEIRRTRIGLAQVVEAAIEAARPLLDAKRHVLAVDLPPGNPTVHADPQRLAQVISNLLTNAAKYTDPGGHVTLSGQVGDGRLRIAVRDDGIGLTGPALRTIFEMFSQVQDARHRSDGGLGIGLALVRGLVALHGGTVEARSDGPGRGSEFVVDLPCGEPAGEAAAPAAAVVADAVPPAAPAACRILVADDNRDAADSLAMVLRLGGHDVRVVHTGSDALAVADEFRPDVAILDIGMPGCSGYRVATTLRQRAWAAALTLIALTGWGQHDDQRQARAAGFDHHLTKPADVDELQRLLAGRRAAPP
jgi:PAS domain S-box-containing protein